MDEKLIDKLQKILALTTSPEEGEAQAAAEMLQKLLTKHGLQMADLERKGQATPGVREEAHDLGKAAFVWKLDLAEALAQHYYCLALVNRTGKTVSFVGRPDNVEAMQMLYGWLMDQIKRIAREERKANYGHIDPLRFQVNFGNGAVQRLRVRMAELKRQRQAEADTMALVVQYDTEISDYLENQYGYRHDGKETKKRREEREAWERKSAEKAAFRAECEAAGNLEPFYQQYPYDRPLDPEEQARRERIDARWRKQWEAEYKRSERSRKAAETRRANRGQTWDEWHKENQAGEARQAGHRAADNINLQPFLNKGTQTKQEVLN